MVVVTHEMRFACEVADWVVFMDQGRILVQGPPAAVFDNSGEPRLEQFFAAVTGTPQPPSKAVRSGGVLGPAANELPIAT